MFKSNLNIIHLVCAVFAQIWTRVCIVKFFSLVIWLVNLQEQKQQNIFEKFTFLSTFISLIKAISSTTRTFYNGKKNALIGR